jgi:hypothetical protein
VFHLMRAVEWAMRAFCGHLGFTEVVEKYDRGGGNHEYRSIEYATWEKVLGQLRGKIDEHVAKITDRAEKQEAQAFYVNSWQEIWAIKEAWRNHVMHSRVHYSPEDAVAILAHVRRLMVTLSKRVGEV